MKQIQKAIEDGCFLLDLPAKRLRDALASVLDRCVALDLVAASRRDQVLKDLLERETASSTAIGDAVAIPHSYLPELENPVIFFVRLKKPLNLGAPDDVATQYLVVMLGPTGKASDHLDSLMAVAKLMSDDDFRYDIHEAKNQEQLLVAFHGFYARRAPKRAKTEEYIPDSLRRTGRLAGGVIEDVKRKLPFFSQDVKNGLHPKAVSSILFLYFACLAPAITFGGFMSQVTGGSIGAVEMLVATAACGVVFAIFSGQPLIILGGTGPLLVLTEVLYVLCARMDLPFLPVYAWVGLWSGFFMIVLAITDASALIRYFTRFTDEIFAALISIIFIVEAVTRILAFFEDGSTSLTAALLSLLLALGTFYVGVSLSRLRRSHYLHGKIREFLADFGPTIAVVSMTTLTLLYFSEVKLPALDVPEKLATTSGRSWIVPLFEIPVWVIFAAIGPAILTTILIYLDQNITARLVNNPDHKLQHGEGYHLDSGVVGFLVAACSLFGLPWLVAATVRSLNHLRSLATTEQSSVGADRILHVRENRITGIAIHLLIGASLLLLPWLKFIPLPVLYGLFLFMGIMSITGNQFFDRLSLWFMESTRYPANHYVRRVPNAVIHKFTILQTVCLAVLWVVKTSAVGILFPLFIALLVPIRLMANRWFKKEHLEALDAEELPEEDEVREVGAIT